MAPQPQTYANHVHRPRAWALTWGLAVLATGWLAAGAVRAGTRQAWVLVLLGVSVVMAVTLIRTFALRLQNRIIRLEMQVRLSRLGLDLPDLPLAHLVALRFASDGELPALMRRAVAERLTPAQIKKAVTDWQADYLRT